jgi:hypothetical protein
MHLNPRLDVSAHIGLNLLIHFEVLNEPFPDFMDPKDYANRPLYHSFMNYKMQLPPTTMHDNWKAFFDYNEGTCTKITHQPCVDLQQCIMDKGCNPSHLEHLCGYAPIRRK